MTEHRHTADTINDDALDELYARLEGIEAENAKLRTWHEQCPDREPRARAEAALETARDRVNELEQQLSQARAGEAVLGQRVVGWADLAKSHQEWGQRRWNAWKSARRRAARAGAVIDRVRSIASTRLADDECGVWERHGYHSAMAEIRAALDGAEQPKESTTP